MDGNENLFDFSLSSFFIFMLNLEGIDCKIARAAVDW